MHARRVDDEARLDVALCRGKRETFARFFDRGHFAFPFQLDAVTNRRLDERERVFPRADDARRGRIQRAADVLGDVRLHFARLVGVDQPQIRHAVFHAALVQFADHCFVVIVERRDERADALEGHVQLFTDLARHRVALHVQTRHERAAFGVVPGVNDRAVGAARPHRHVVFPLQNENAQFSARKLVGRRGADDAAADDRYIVHGAKIPLSFVMDRRDPRGR